MIAQQGMQRRPPHYYQGALDTTSPRLKPKDSALFLCYSNSELHPGTMKRAKSDTEYAF